MDKEGRCPIPIVLIIVFTRRKLLVINRISISAYTFRAIYTDLGAFIAKLTQQHRSNGKQKYDSTKD